jgi:hypothetical protein
MAMFLQRQEIGSTALTVASQPIGLVTEGPSYYGEVGQTQTVIGGLSVAATIAQSCALVGTTEADCSLTLVGTVSTNGANTVVSTAVSYVYSGTNYNRFQVPITDGSSKTATAAGATCPTPSAGPTITVSTVGNRAATGHGRGAIGAALGALGTVGAVLAFFT